MSTKENANASVSIQHSYRTKEASKLYQGHGEVSEKQKQNTRQIMRMMLEITAWVDFCDLGPKGLGPCLGPLGGSGAQQSRQ